MEFVSAIVQLIVGVSWPAAAVLLALIFRDQIRRKLKDVLEAGITGVKFNQPPQVTKSEIRETGGPKIISDLPRTPFFEEVEDKIKIDLELISEDSKIPVLVRQLAQTRIERAFESVYSSIFGSQIRGLFRLRTEGGSVTLITAKGFFEEVKADFSDALKDWNFYTWFSYLSNNQLAKIEGENVVLTGIGQDFLAFVEATKAGDQRPI